MVYHPRYLFGSKFLNRFHPFEFDRAIEAMNVLEKELGGELAPLVRSPREAARLDALAAVHDQKYLSKVRQSQVIARIIEVHQLSMCPRFLMKRWFLNPSLWCVAGTLLAAREALKDGLTFNLGGGFHHAKRSWGEGFCLFSDIALALHDLRTNGVLERDDTVFYIDLDVHQGNGVSCDFGDDPTVRILDLFNEDIYPFRDHKAREGIDVARPLPSGCRDEEYLETLDDGLAELFAGHPAPKLVIYNAGTDVFEEDLLGDMRLTREGVNRRDLTVLEAVRGRGIPMAVLASGGYSKSSAQLLANFVLGAYRYEKNRPAAVV